MFRSTLYILSALTLTLLLVTGCASDSGDAITGTGDGGDSILVDGTGDPATSCFDRCGAYDANKLCQCDPLCHTNEDCCTDFCGMCTTQTNFADACQGEPTCTPECTGKLCGDDGCGGSCGACGAGTTCDLNGACVSTCGNGVCDVGENANSCPGDCGPPPSVCGDGVCDADEQTVTCPQDCPEDTSPPSNSCVERCGVYDSEASCQCDSQCPEIGDCCADLCDNCGADDDAFAVYCGLCTPACQGKVCGEDGCGGECGPGCGLDETCTNAGLCEKGDVVCIPACDGKQCGDDGCGSTCGPGCADTEICTDAGLCEVDNTCTPVCGDDWECGDDGCGGACPGGCPKVAPICDANHECQLTFTVNPCWDQECPEPVQACKDNGACGALATCLSDAPDPTASDCYANLETQFGPDVAQAGAELYNDIQYCGWASCAATEGTCQDVCGKYVGPTSCNCDATVCTGAQGQCLGGPADPVDGEQYGCSFYGDCCADYEALCDADIECIPQCGGKQCGGDGCGGLCGSGCGLEEICTEAGLCESTCVPVCAGTGAVCGADGCGDTCGSCDPGLACDDSGQCSITLQEGECTSFFADQCLAGQDCFVIGDEGICVDSGGGAEDDACVTNDECGEGTLCIGSTCLAPECDVTEEYAPCDGKLVCIPNYSFDSETGETSYADIGVCLEGCEPFGLNTCGPGKQCIAVTTEPLQGICVEWEVGEGQVGDGCDGEIAPCGAGLICVTMTDGNGTCWDSCALAAETGGAGSCPQDQTCDPLYSGTTGVPLAFGFCQEPECSADGDLCTLGTSNDDGFLCIDDGLGQGICQISCIPYIGDAVCPATQWCEPLALDDGGTCQDVPNAGADLGEDCDGEVDPCEAELTCVAGTCKLLCDPEAEADAEGACNAGESCGGLQGADGILTYGACMAPCDFHGGDLSCDAANEVCLPEELLVDADTDLCSPMNHPDYPLELGAACPEDMGYCVEGALCALDGLGFEVICTKICFLVNGLLDNPVHPDCSGPGDVCNDVGMDDWGVCQ